MKFAPICVAMMLFLARTSSAACIDDLHKLADESFPYNEATDIDYTQERSTEGGVFMVYFDKSDNKITVEPVTPPNNQDSGGHVIVVRAETYGETGRVHERITFLSKDNFVIRAIIESFEGQIYLPRGGVILKEESTDYLFCAGKLQLPKDIEGSEKQAEFRKNAEDERALFFDAPELAAHIERIKK